uniref:Group II intron reverse transcriptase maturase protein n=1 Tax=Laurencia catarinensis TaxID=197326 RepID=UPI0028D0690B|nr:Group II intron reverse transcriptase maturase protein [Laurencia catarinensis]WMP12453.1 Group II intron reverse transcriptase maturase protein [Laurencia catarinensis]
MIQRQIYIASKKHDIYYVYELQKYLINSNEAKLILIKNTLDRVKAYYLYSRDSYLFYDKHIIYKAVEIIFYKYLILNTNLLILNTEVKNKLLYLSILPVYQAKLKKDISQSLIKSNDYKIYSIYGLSNLSNSCNNILFNNNFIRVIINKLQLSRSMNRSIINYFYSGYTYSSFSISDISLQQCLISKPNKIKNLFVSSYNLTDLILNILSLDKSWFFFKTQLKKYNTQNLQRSINKSILSNINNISSEITKQISFSIYDKIHDKFRLIRIFNYRNKFVYYLIRIYLRYCKESNIFFFFSLIKDCHKFINVLLYAYQKKINNLNEIRRIVNLNYYVNLYINYYNIMNFDSF